MSKRISPWGLVAEFPTSSSLLHAIERSREEGYEVMDAFSPYPIEEISEALGHHHSRLPALVLIGAIIGGLAGFGLQYWTSVIDYPLNVGGRPLNSIIAFLPVIFECTILFGALTAVFGMLALNGLPRPHHPVFNSSRFKLASQDAFFLSIEARDPKFSVPDTPELMSELGASSVEVVDD
jgi:hypothetical protein